MKDINIEIETEKVENRENEDSDGELNNVEQISEKENINEYEKNNLIEIIQQCRLNNALSKFDRKNLLKNKLNIIIKG